MSCADEVFIDIGLWCGALDAANGRGLADVVDLADDGEDRAVDVAERDEVASDGEPAAHHAVVGDELLEQFRDRRTRPRDVAIGHEEAALLLARQKCLAVVQLTNEVESRLRGLDRIEQLEPRAGQPAGNVDAAEDVVGHEVGGADRQAGGQVHRQSGQGVDGRPERDDARKVLRPSVRGGLVGEHAALRVAGEVDVAVGDLLHGVDGFAQRDDVIGEVALHAALDLVGGTEVDDPRIDARRVQDADGALVAGDVPHVGRHHHRVHHQHRRPGRLRARPGVRREVPPQPIHRHALDDLER